MDFPPTPELLAERLRGGLDDGVERTTRHEHMWRRSDDSLAYGPGIPFPVAELPNLMGNDEHEAKMHGRPWSPPEPKRGRK